MHTFEIGRTVAVSVMGLAGTPVVVDSHIDGPDSQPFYTLTFAHNGNRVPGYYDERLLDAPGSVG